MIIYVDIDDTITITNGREYKDAIPVKERIATINELYHQGNYIVYWTARGTKTGIDWTELTKKQLADWGVKYNELKMGKPVYDLFIDDKNINSNNFFNEETYK